ncbi:NAD-dependent epimerase/dehydratase family protein [Planctobacterium marinum]|uniref:NAD-dependent epimerase/dehydratase family protein n=1 Tax=Planctobacterium marinum TaxID=1631968 RepID=UPI001E4EF666|nr:NAD(P)-dependent oxidoreductase [Planctobacterium marinum]MCC2606117.1 NAD(P)-dependent oxidoreductase [Planctobacterium marinum]
MRVVITGHTGFLGAELYNAFVQSFDTFGFATSNGFSLTDANTLEILPDKCDLVIHCAARMDVDVNNFVNSIDVNVRGSLHMAEYALDKGAKLIHISSIFAIEHNDNQYYDGYGASKKIAEDVLLQYAKLTKLDLLILRLPQLYDLEGRAKKSQAMLYRLIDQVTLQHKAVIYGELDPQRNYLYIKDIQELILELSSSPLSGCYNCPHPNSVSATKLVRRIAKVHKIEVPIEFLQHKENLKTIHVPTTNLIWEHVRSLPKNNILDDMSIIIGRYREK